MLCDILYTQRRFAKSHFDPPVRRGAGVHTHTHTHTPRELFPQMENERVEKLSYISTSDTHTEKCHTAHSTLLWIS